MAHAAMRLACVSKMHRPNPGRDTGFSEFLVFSSVPPDTVG
jgi:hypothetical protein